MPYLFAPRFQAKWLLQIFWAWWNNKKEINTVYLINKSIKIMFTGELCTVEKLPNYRLHRLCKKQDQS